VRYYNFRRSADQFGGVSARELRLVTGPAKLDVDVAAFGPSDLAQSLPESRDAKARFRVILYHPHQYTDPPLAALLRAHRDWPRRYTAEKRDELAPSHCRPKANDKLHAKLAHWGDVRFGSKTDMCSAKRHVR
jgi:hypothetical protein